MLTIIEYVNLWNSHFAHLKSALGIPDYYKYIDRAHMLEDYLDIFRGINTRGNRSIQPCNGWYYHHPFFYDDGSPKCEKKTCIKYIMIGEACPENGRNYFYNINEIGQTAWLREPLKKFHKNYKKPKNIIEKSDQLLQLAKSGYLLLDLYPFDLKYSKKIRETINYSPFWDLIVNSIVNFKKNKLIDENIKIGFSGPAATHHQIVEDLVLGKITFTIFLKNTIICKTTKNEMFINNILTQPTKLYKYLAKWENIPVKQKVSLNKSVLNKSQFISPIYQCECWDASYMGPNSFFISIAFN